MSRSWWKAWPKAESKMRWMGGWKWNPTLFDVKTFKVKVLPKPKNKSDLPCPCTSFLNKILSLSSFWLSSFYLPEHAKREQEVIPRFVLMHLPGKITYREIDEMIATVDKNEDWKISYSEFRVSFCCLRAETMYKRIFRTVLFAAYCFHICDHNRYQNDCTHWGYSDMENVKYFTQVNLPKYLPDKKV